MAANRAQKNKISLKFYLAEEILREIYSGEVVNKDFCYLQDVGYDYLPKENVLQMYARAFNAEVNKKAALMVLESLSEKKRELMRLKYGEGKQLVAISLALDMSISQLMKWNQVIVARIASFMVYQLTAEDIFCKKEILGMVELLSRSIEFFSVLSVEYNEVRQDWLRELERKRNNYQKLLSRIERIENDCDKTMFKEVLLTKIQNPYWTSENVAEKCRIERSVVYKYLKRFANSVKEYLN